MAPHTATAQTHQSGIWEDGKQSDSSSENQNHPEIWDSAQSPFNYYFGYISSSAISLWLLCRVFYGNYNLDAVPRLIAIATSGLITWTLVEYWFHRLLYHRVAGVMRTGHEMHHVDPKALLGIPYYYHGGAYILLYLLFTFVFNPAYVGLFLGAFSFGHLTYNSVHHATHRWTFKNSLFKKVKAHHLIHHHRDDVNFGISCPYWDIVFRTKA